MKKQCQYCKKIFTTGGLNQIYPVGIWTPWLQYKIRKRDNYKCQYCNKKEYGMDNIKLIDGGLSSW